MTASQQTARRRASLAALIAALALALTLLGSAGCVNVTGASDDQGANPTITQDASGASDGTTTEPPAASDRHHESSHDDHDSEHESDHHFSFRNHHALEEHFEKHGAEVGCATVEEYLAAANAVIANPDALHKLEAEDGDDVYFLESTGEFVVVSPNGYIRTYFITDRDYFDRQ